MFEILVMLSEGVEAPLHPAFVSIVGVLRLRECFATRNIHCAQDDTVAYVVVAGD
jgi:hypothetical protein